jgi:hypothetical protein
MAEQCFGLDREEVVSSRGFARVPALEPIDGFKSLISERARRGVLGGITVAPNKHLCVDVIFIRTALSITIRKYEKYGDMLYFKLLVNDYSMEHEIEFWNDLYPTNDIVFLGFAEAVRKYWQSKHYDANMLKHMMITTLPYLHPNKYPSKLEMGVLCEGCARNAFYKDGKSLDEARNFGELKAHLHDTFPTHFDSCSIAQSISQGLFLTIKGELGLFVVLMQKKLAYWPREGWTPEEMSRIIRQCPARANWTAHRFQARVALQIYATSHY